MNSFDEVFEHVKRYCLEKGQIPEVAVKLWIDALHPVDLSGTDAVFYHSVRFSAFCHSQQL